MLHLSASRQVCIRGAMLSAFVAKLFKDLSYLGLLEHFGREFVRHLPSLSSLPRSALALDTETLFDGVPVDNRTIGGQ